MKKILILILCLFVINVYADKVPYENGKVSIGNYVFFENGSASDISADGIKFDSSTYTLSFTNSYSNEDIYKGIEILNMDYITIDISAPVKINVEDISNAFYILNSEVKITSSNNSRLTLSSLNNGLYLDGTSKVTMDNVSLYVDSIKLNDTSSFNKESNATLFVDNVYLNNKRLPIVNTNNKLSINKNSTKVQGEDIINNEVQKKNNLVNPIIIVISVVGIVLIIIFLIIKLKNPKTKNYDPLKDKLN